MRLDTSGAVHVPDRHDPVSGAVARGTGRHSQKLDGSEAAGCLDGHAGNRDSGKFDRICRRTTAREGATMHMTALRGAILRKIRCSTAGFAGFVSECVEYSRVPVSTADPISYAAPDLPHCQRVFSPLCWTP